MNINLRTKYTNKSSVYIKTNVYNNVGSYECYWLVIYKLISYLYQLLTPTMFFEQFEKLILHMQDKQNNVY